MSEDAAVEVEQSNAESFILGLETSGAAEEPSPEAAEEEPKVTDEAEPEAQTEEQPEPEPEKEPEAEPTLEELRKQLADAQQERDKEEQRRKDTQADWQRANQRLKELEAEQEKKPDPPPTTEVDADLVDWQKKILEQITEDPEKALTQIPDLMEKVARQASAREAQRVQKMFEDQIQQQRASELARQEAQARKDHETDTVKYDDAVTADFVKRLNSDDALHARWQEDGGSAESAYKLALKEAEIIAFRDDPDGFIARKIEEAAKGKEAAATPEGTDEPETLAGVNSAQNRGRKSKGSAFDDPEVPVENILFDSVRKRDTTRRR